MIRQVPRTATVTAAEAGLLFAMDGPAFLALVTKRRGAAERFLALYREPDDEPAPNVAGA